LNPRDLADSTVTLRQDSMSRSASRKAWFTGLAAGGFLFALLAVNNFTGVWPQPWLFLEVLVGLGSMLVMFQGIVVVVFTHPVAPRGEAQKWAWAGVSTRFWFLLLGSLLAPVGFVGLAAGWKQSHGWALLWGACGVASAVIAYLAGRPWPRAD
jgi:hypothetical protein